MSQPSHLLSNSTTTTTTTLNPKLYTAKAKAYDCFLFLLFIVVASIVIASVPAITRGLIFLQPGIPEFKVSSSSLAILNVSSTTATTNFSVTLSVKNPNSKPMSYDKIVALVLDGDESLSSTTIPSFNQPGKSQGTLQADFPSFFFQISNHCNETTTGCGAMNLTTELHAKAKYGGWTWPKEKDSIQVRCDEDMKVEFPPKVTTMGFGSSECDVSGQWKRIVTKCTKIFWNYVYVVSIFLLVLFLSL